MALQVGEYEFLHEGRLDTGTVMTSIGRKIMQGGIYAAYVMSGDIVDFVFEAEVGSLGKALQRMHCEDRFGVVVGPINITQGERQAS